MQTKKSARPARLSLMSSEELNRELNLMRPLHRKGDLTKSGWKKWEDIHREISTRASSEVAAGF